MTWTDLASLPVDHPHPTVGKLSLNQHSSRPGTPIVTPRTTFPLTTVPPSRPVSRLTNLGTPPEEREEEEEEEEEELDQEEEEENKQKEHYPRKARQGGFGVEADSCEDLVSTLSALSLSSSSGCDTCPPVPTTPSVRAKSPPCTRSALKATSRALTAASTSYRTRHSKYCSCSSSHHSSEVKMVDAKVIYASSHDPNFPPAAAVDGRNDTFWTSSGLYPQFLVMSLPGLTSIENVNLVAYNVRKVSIARSIKTQPTDFEEISQEELKQVEGKLQESAILSQHVSAIHLRITIEEGYNHFCSVHRVSVEGSVSPAYGSGNSNNNAPITIRSEPQTITALTPSSINNDSNIAMVNSMPAYHRPQSPLQVMSKGPPPLTQVEQAGEDDDDDDHGFGFQNSANVVRSLENDDDLQDDLF